MYAIEFQTTIKDGKIEIPKSYHAQLTEQVRVIVLSEKQPEVATAVNTTLSSLEKQPLTAETLLNSGLIGLWADREDITDNLEFARQLRREAEQRPRNPHVAA